MYRFPKHGQLSTELSVLMGVLIVLFLIVLGVVLDQRRSIPSNEHIQAMILTNNIAQTIDALATASEGTRATTKLPGGNYTLQIFPKTQVVSVLWDQEEVSSLMRTSLVNGTLQWTPGATMTMIKGDTYVTLS